MPPPPGCSPGRSWLRMARRRRWPRSPNGPPPIPSPPDGHWPPHACMTRPAALPPPWPSCGWPGCWHRTSPKCLPRWVGPWPWRIAARRPSRCCVPPLPPGRATSTCATGWRRCCGRRTACRPMLALLEAAIADFGPHPTLLLNQALALNVIGEQEAALAAADAAMPAGGDRRPGEPHRRIALPSERRHGGRAAGGGGGDRRGHGPGGSPHSRPARHGPRLAGRVALRRAGPAPGRLADPGRAGGLAGGRLRTRRLQPQAAHRSDWPHASAPAARSGARWGSWRMPPSPPASPRTVSIS